MPYFSFATYADYREEWAIQANSLEHAIALIGTDASGDWLEHAFHVDGDCVGRRDEFWTGADGLTPEVTEITPDHWAFRAANRDQIEHSMRQNIAALSGDFHAHRRYAEFYDTFEKMIDGFVGQYELCIAMGEALTDWETYNEVSGIRATSSPAPRLIRDVRWRTPAGSRPRHAAARSRFS